ncbi:MarR family winged helix-turn-helix transcriptional regulator [Clostridium formicaceticum]|uniref:HTH-type transcriptional regulator SarZ n=1 Tax=Clostridium formicaceticum TaxID=1497 RepID=A0AAC9RFX5_9CLOT|nr:MarR family transcriptional regulator [Clostridium formicaceticum]AOY75739.1 MarR family transcriptional regulator [Clostridium formicaceticum]ARE86061.1 transcriptional repressor MprA [Clostridium formicaceticum]
MRNYYVEINEYLQKLVKNTIFYDRKGICFSVGMLSITDLLILKALGDEKEKKMYEIIDDLGIDRNVFATIINKLQQQQFIMKTKSKRDKRVQILSLTEKGQDVFREITSKEKEIIFSLLNDFSFNEEKAVLKFLVKLDMLRKEKNKTLEETP